MRSSSLVGHQLTVRFLTIRVLTMTSRIDRLTELVRGVAFAGRAAAEEWVRDSGLTRQQAFTLGYLEQNRHRDVIARELAEMSGTTAGCACSMAQPLMQAVIGKR